MVSTKKDSVASKGFFIYINTQYFVSKLAELFLVSEVDVEAEPVDPKLVTVQLDVTSKNKLRVKHITLSEAPSKELVFS